jgi:hypothetical protein
MQKKATKKKKPTILSQTPTMNTNDADNEQPLPPRGKRRFIQTIEDDEDDVSDPGQRSSSMYRPLRWQQWVKKGENQKYQMAFYYPSN